MAAGDDDAPPEARPPLLSDLVGLCRRLNAANAAYVVIGGVAVIQAGFPRATGDIDLLIDPSPENQRRVQDALMGLPDQAVRDMGDDDLDRGEKGCTCTAITSTAPRSGTGTRAPCCGKSVSSG